MFGVESGAYTGAHRERQGRFEAANDGTLFLDEIGTLSLSGQVKLLRVLETGRFERLGSSRSLQSRTRIVSATNSDLKAMVKIGQFREDLYYRLNVIEIQLPSLAERRDDIIALADHFLAGRAVLAASAHEALLAHDWPGNVRELKNVIERAALLAGGRDIDAALLNLPAPFVKAARNLDEPSREAVLAALTQAQGIVSSAAVLLGLSRQALYRRMARYGLTPAEPA